MFEQVFLEISVPFDFFPGIFGSFSCRVRFPEIQQFPDFVELFNENFHTICTGYENFQSMVEWKAV